MLRLVFACAAALLPLHPLAAQESCEGQPGALRLQVNVEGLRSSAGLVAVTLYPDDRSRFLRRRGSLFVARVPARAPRTRLCLNLPLPGTYALAVYHDADGNRRFNRSGIGLPAEAYGFSNNPPVLFGLPNFRAVRIAVPRTGIQATVRLRYP